MRKELFEYSKDKTSIQLFEALSKEEKEILNDFKTHMLTSASEERSKEAIREVLRFKEVVGVKFNEVELRDLEYFLEKLKKSNFADHSKNKIKGHIQKFLRRMFKDWSLRFDNFDVIRYNSDAERKNAITSETLLTEEEIEKLLEAEKSLFWKTFLKVQYMAGLRTGETRSLLYKSIKFDDENDICSIDITSKKNKNATPKTRTIPLDKGSTYYLLELKKQQKTLGIETNWVFPSPKDPTKHISKSVNAWFKKLTKKVLGREVTNYTLRHKKATELREKIKKNELSMDNAIEFMGHSERMFKKTYSHMGKDEIVKIMREQLYGFKPLSEEKKAELEKQVDILTKDIHKLSKKDELNNVAIGLLLKQFDPKKMSSEDRKVLKAMTKVAEGLK